MVTDIKYLNIIITLSGRRLMSMNLEILIFFFPVLPNSDNIR